MRIERFDDPEEVARQGAARIAAEARAAISARGRFLLAVSGGATPWRMLRVLAGEGLPWAAVHLFQVDERLVLRGSPDRNLTHLRETLIDRVAIPPGHVHAMPVDAPEPVAAAAAYAAELCRVAGTPPQLDVIHLGLGADGHTASLVPGDPALEVRDAYVAVTGVYQGTRRMTLTFPAIAPARRILWIVTGTGKRDSLARLHAGDARIPASRIPSERAVVIADRAAM